MFGITKTCVLVAAATFALASPIEKRQVSTYCQGTDYPCTDGIFVLAIRATDIDYLGSPFAVNPEYYDIGLPLEAIARNVAAEAGGTSYCRALPYAAAPGGPLTNPPFFSYFLSIGYGIDVGQGIIRDYVNRCGAGSRIVLLGYSQGGQVGTSILIGDLGKPSLDDLQQYITAGAFIASPSFVAGFSPIDSGNATLSGIFPRDVFSYDYFNRVYGNRIRNYCQADDTFCASGGFDQMSIDIHNTAVETFQQNATNFLSSVV